MKEFKLEEGEACDDSTVDPDIALSYIDEKLQDVLGHFQKDFEDGVSSENLGSKFGGYGSFLPTYQRSPSWTCTRTPPEAYNNNISIPPSNLRAEVGRRPSLASSSTPLELKAPAANGKKSLDEDSTSKSEIVKKPTNLSDKRAPKLHTRLGTENLSTQKKAEIYSGLGLDVSPSSSPDDSPMNDEGLSCDLKDSRYESPTSILQIMTSYPMHDGLLLSPLSDDLICLTEKGKLWGKRESECMIQENLETSVSLLNGTHYANKSDGKVISAGRILETCCNDVQTTEVVKEVFMADSSLESKSKKTLSKSGSQEVKKNHVRNRYRDFFGDIKAEDDDDDEAGLLENHSPVMLKVSDAAGNKSLVEHNSSIKQRVGVGKTEKPCTSAEYSILASNGPTSVDALHASRENPNFGVQAIDSSRKTRYGLKGSPSGTKEHGSQHLGLPNSSFVEKRRHKNKEKKISLDNHSDGGTKMRNTSEVELDVSSKKIKRDDAHDDENWTFYSSSGFSHNVSGKIQDRYINRDSEDDSKKDLVSTKNPEAHISDVSMHMEKCDDKDSSTKRKGSELRDSMTCNPQDFMEKKARVSKSDHKDTSASKGSAGTGQVKKEQQAEQDLDSTLSLQSVKAEDSSKRDLCSSQPSVAASSALPTSSPKRSFNGENNGFSNQSSMVKKENDCNGKGCDLEFSEADLEEKHVHCESGKSGTKVKAKTMVSGHTTHQDADLNACKKENSDQGSDKERKNDHHSGSVSNGRRGSSSRPKEKTRAPKSDSDQHQMPLDEEKMAPGNNKSLEKSAVGSDRLKKKVRLDVGSRLDKKQTEVSSKSPLTRDQNETVVFKEPVPGSERVDGAKLVTIDAFEREKSSSSRHGKKAKSHRGNLDVPSPFRKDSSSQAATNAIKEATNLKHLADRLKNSGSSESTGIYFQAALKFLHGASLLELDSSKHGEVNQSRRIYSSTAKLCQFCGHEYEKLKDMAAAALAYKCMEVAYMRVIYSSQSDANRYRNELQTALQIFPPGESPFSSVSDVDNLNNSTIVDKAASAKVVGSPQVAGTQVVSARNGSSFMRLINLAQEVNFAMEASRKSRVAFAAANSGPGDSQCKEGALHVKKALDFNFQDVDGLLRLVRVAMEAISH